jgi:hypothetical protein
MTPTECAELFAKTLEELNAVGLQQMQGILNVVVTGLEAAKSLGAPSGDPAAADKLAGLVSDLKSAIDTASQNNQNTSSADAPKPDDFCAEVEANINLAMQNSVAFQQELNTISAAALGKVIEDLITLQRQ